MKRLTLIPALILALALLPSSSAGQNTGESAIPMDELQIRGAVTELYIKGLQVRDFGLIREICLPDALLMSVDDEDQLHVTTLDTWSRRFDPENPPFQSLDYTILRIDNTGTAAQVKILFIVDGNRRVIDYLHMLKVEGRWRVVNIIDH